MAQVDPEPWLGQPQAHTFGRAVDGDAAAGPSPEKSKVQGGQGRSKPQARPRTWRNKESRDASPDLSSPERQVGSATPPRFRQPDQPPPPPMGSPPPGTRGAARMFGSTLR